MTTLDLYGKIQGETEREKMNENKKSKPKKNMILVNLIEKLGKSQRQIADDIGYPSSYFNRIVNGHRELPRLMAEKLNAEYGCSFDYLLGKSKKLILRIKDDTDIALENLHKTFDKITTTKHHTENLIVSTDGSYFSLPTDPNCLMFTVDNALHEFLLDFKDIEHSKDNEKSKKIYNNRIEEIKSEYYENKGKQPIECVLVPMQQYNKFLDECVKFRTKFNELKEIGFF